MSTTKIDSMLYAIEAELMKRQGVDAAHRALAPLSWYINTGRASTAFLHALAAARPVLIARDLAKGGSYEDAVNRVCRRIKYERS
jgi:hypothetical protein